MTNIAATYKHLLITACTLLLSSCTGTSTIKEERLLLKEFLHTTINNGIMIGHQDDLIYGNDWFAREGWSDIKKISGDYPAITGFNISKIETGEAINIDSIPFTLIEQKIQEAYRNNIIISINWNIDNTTNFIESLDKLADFLLSIRNEQGKLIPIIFHPFTSFNQTDSRLSLSPETFKKLWIEMVDYLKHKKKIDNILYAWSAYAPVTTTELAAFYPGNEYVDIVGIDLFFCYNTDPQGKIYNSNLDKALATASQFALEHGKVSALTSTGLEGVKTANYFTGYLYPVVSKYELSYILFGRNAWNKEEHYHIPAPGHPAGDDFIEFVSKPNIFLLKDIKEKYN